MSEVFARAAMRPRMHGGCSPFPPRSPPGGVSPGRAPPARSAGSTCYRRCACMSQATPADEPPGQAAVGRAPAGPLP
jgi:hypothetical protein